MNSSYETEFVEERYIRPGDPEVILIANRYPLLYGGGYMMSPQAKQDLAYEPEILIRRRYPGEDWKTITRLEYGKPVL